MATVPGAPTNVRVTAQGKGWAVVAWNTPSSNGGSSITGYYILASDGQSQTVAPSNNVTFNTLTFGGTYTFKVTAKNSVGWSAYSASSTAITIANVPGAPTGVYVSSSGDGSATVNWTAPASDGGYSIGSYTVVPSAGNWVSTDASARSATVSGLTNGTAVTFRVYATSYVGDSAYSAASAAVTPSRVPDAPSGLWVSWSGYNDAWVNWNAPYNGGAAITGYTITCSDGKTVTANGSDVTAYLSGLTPGVAVTFTVKATNLRGTSASSAASGAFTPSKAPDAPTGVSAVAGNASATVSWSAPASNGAAITGYTVTPSVGSAVTVGNVTTASFTNLTNGTALTFTVKATNARGDSAASAASGAVTPSTVPGAPTGVSAVAGNASATVSWTAPASNGGAAITSYTVTSSLGETQNVGTNLNASFTGLVAGTALTFAVKATNVRGDSASSSSFSITPFTVADAPTGVSAIGGNTSATVSWTAPASNGASAITGYTVTPSVGSPVTVGNVLTATVSNLTNGTAVTFTVKAINAAGSSADSSASLAVTPSTIPDAPTGVSAVPGTSPYYSAIISWTAPASNGGQAIVGYVVTSSDGDSVTVGGNILTATLNQLVGTPLTFTVAAANGVGLSSSSSPSAPITPITVAGAPTAVSAVAGNTSATVSWTAPASNGGSEITGYTVTPSVGSPVTVGNVLNATLSGLTNGTAVSFTVKAINAAGSSSDSSESSSVTPATIPGVPTDISIESGNQSVTLSWSPPASDGGSAITGYTVTPSVGSPVTVGNVLTASVSNLTNGTPVSFTVKSINSVGSSPESSSITATPTGSLPGAPTNVLAVAGNGTATVSWTAPISQAGSEITGYLVTPSVGTAVTLGNVLTTTFTNLTNGTLITFTVKSINTAGTSSASSSLAVTPSTIPDAPTGVSAFIGNSSARVFWTPPASNGGSEITAYTVTSSLGSQVTVGNVINAYFTNLTNGTAVTFTVKATNSRGDSAASAASVAVTPMTVPDAPTGVSAIAGNASATVSWSAPASNGGSEITGYTVTPSVGSPVTVGNVLTATVSNLTNGTAVTFTVKAINAVGISSASAASFTEVPYNPSEIPGLQVWLDGSDPNGTGTQPSAGTAITTWADKSGNGYNGTGVAGPTFIAGGGIALNGSQLFTVSYSGLHPNESAFIVIKDFTSTSANQNLIEPTTDNARVFYIHNGYTILTHYNVGGNINGPSLTSGSQILGYNYSSSSVGIYTNGTGNTGAGFTSVSEGSIKVGRSCVGTISEVLIYNRVLSTSQRQQVEGYLAWKWGLVTRLQNTHPYYFIAPIPGPVVLLQAKNYSGSGAWLDESGYARNATLAAGTISKNTAGNGIVLNGSSFWTFPNVGLGNAWTANVWFKRTGNQTGIGACILTQQYTHTNVNLTIGDSGNNNNTVSGGFYLTNGYTNQSGSIYSLPLNTWVNIQVTWNGANIITYINGTLDSSVAHAKTALDGGLPYNIGKRSDLENGFYNVVGEIGEVRIYNYALSGPQVLQDYNNSLFMFQQQTAPFKPTQIPGLQMWLDGADPLATGTAPPPSSAITTWADKSGNGYNGTGVANPPYLSGGGVSLNGSTQYFTTNYTNAPTTETAFMVIKYTVAGGPIISTTHNSGGRVIYNDGTKMTMQVYGSPQDPQVFTGTANYTVGTTFMYNYAYGSTNMSTFLNGTSDATVANPPAFYGNGTTNIGYYTYPLPEQTFVNASIYEIIIFNTVLTSQQRQKVEGYLAWKWGLKPRLQDIHPYYSNSITPATLPGAPTAVSAVAGNASATLSWTAPASNGGSAITGYTVTSSTGQTVTVGNATTATVSNLTNGTAVTFTVKAINAVGSSSSSTASSAVTPVTVPGAPTSVSVFAGNASASVSWNAPASDGGSAITGYTVTPSVGSPVTVRNVRIATLTNLTNGTPVTFTVVAINALGSSLTSSSSPVTPTASLPGSPTGISAVAGTNSTTVSWNAPVSNGSSPITGYIITPSVGSPITVGNVLTADLPTVSSDGTPITYTVVAINAAGSSSASLPRPAVTPATAPGAPTGVSVVAGNSSATISWNAPASNGGSPITGYIITPSVGNPITVGDVRIVTFNGLSNDTPITFTVTAINAVGSSSEPLNSAPPSAVTPVATLPGAPTGISVVPGVNSATVSWTAPAVTGGSPITGYIITPSVGSPITVGSDVLTANFPALANGTPVTFTVTAINSSGSSSASLAPAAITPATLPGAPTGVSVVAGNGSATVSWNAPESNGGSAITGYIITPSVGSPITVGDVRIVTFNGLSNGTPITFTVTAINAVGSSSEPLPPPAVTPVATLPGAPTGISVVPGVNSATVSWTAPAVTGGSPITGYIITPSVGQPFTVDGDVLTASFPVLSDGTPVTFTVTAINSSGSSSASLAPAAVTPPSEASVPGSPTGVSAVASNASATVSWTAPASNGGAEVVGYTVIPSVGIPVTVGNVLNATLSGLTNGTAVSFTVKAINAVGSSSASSASSAVTPVTIPGAPTAVSAVAGNASATVSWTAPGSNGGSAITGYLVTPSVGSPVTVGNVTNATVSNLTNGSPVTFTVVAINAVGSSSASSSSAVTPVEPPTVPGAPTAVSAVAGNASATVSWNAPASDGRSAITGYTVTPSVGSPVTVRNVRITTLTNLTNGTPVTFTVVAINSIGSSSASSSSAVTPTAALPGSPTGISAVAGNSSTTVSWNAPVSSGNSPITGYIITPSVGSPITVGNVLTADLPTVSSDGTPITYTVVAINSDGSSSASLPRPAVTPPAPVTAPGAPTGVSVVAGNGSATVSWNPPASNGGSPITGYIITPSVGSPITVGDVRIVTFNGLSNDTPITFTVTAINAVGSSSEPLNSPASPPPSAVTPLASLPGAPASISVVPGVNSATVSWTAPAVTGGSPITGYIITPSVGSPITVGSDVLSANFPGLTNGIPVTFTVTAINSAGSSSSSLAPTAITPATLPGAPTGVSVVAGNASATVSWNAPESNGGSPITGYIITPSVGSPITVGDVRIVTFDGLSNDTPITFTVTAINAVGSSSVPPVQPPAVTPVATLPSAPTGISVVPGINSATVSWTAPAVTGGSPITGYIITPSVGPPFTVGGDVLTASFPVLSDGTPVTFTVTAINSSGSSSASLAPPAVTPPSEASVPGAPMDVSAVAANASATVSWFAPASNGGAEVVGYIVTPSVGSPVTVGNVLTATLSNLTNGTALTFTVKAINAVGNSAASSSSAVTPFTVPGAPTGVSAVAGTNSAIVSWTAPASNGGSTITGYTVSSSGGHSLTVGNVTTATLDELASGTSLTFTVIAINSAGASLDSSASSAVTPIAPTTAPGAPTGVTAVAGTNSATVSWTAPASNGGSEITGYTVTPSSGLAVTVGNVTTATLTGLASGNAITFTVVAINAIGNSSASSSASATPTAPIESPPSSVLDVTGVAGLAGVASATIRWTPPVSDGGSPVTGYKVICVPDNKKPNTAGPNATSLVIPGIKNGVATTFTVVAINDAGQSDSVIFTPYPLPGAPKVTAVRGTAGVIKLTWVAKPSNAASPITGYVVRLVSPSAPESMVIPTPLVTATGGSVSVSGLTYGSNCVFSVRSVSSIGQSAASLSKAVIAAGLPNAPTSFVGTRAVASAGLSWVAPTNTGGLPILGYKITYMDSAVSTKTVNVKAVTSTLIKKLLNGTPYVFTIQAITLFGTSLPSEPVAVTPGTGL